MFGLVASLALHLAVFAYVARATASFDFEFSLTLPAEVEFGITEEMAMSGSGLHGTDPSKPANAAAGAVPAAGAEPEPPKPALDAGVPLEREARDAGPDAKPSDMDEERPEAEETGEEADADALPVADSTITGPSRIPPGAQLALRIDMRRIRESPLGADVTRFLEEVPDWQLLLAGSGIDPVADLDRLLLATPNLERSKLVLAGKHRRDPGFARQSVRRLAESRGRKLRWQRRFGVPTAPWHNVDRTPRTIALLSPHHFSITRRQDLVRVLALANAREARDSEKEGLLDAQGVDALLSMGPEEAISLEVEGVHRFVIGSTKHVPLRLRVAVRESGPNEASVVARATYGSEQEAQQAAAYWKKVATFYSQQLIMTLAGFGKTLRRMELVVEQERVEVSFELDADQIRFILSYAEGRLQGTGGAMRDRPRSGRPAPTKKGP